MEREDLMHHLAGWRDGIDPASGAVLPADHPAQRTDFLRVVCAAIDALAAAPMPTGAPTRMTAKRFLRNYNQGMNLTASYYLHQLSG